MNKTELVKEHLINKKTITTWEAIREYGATRLSAIIFNLRKQGHIIKDEWQEDTDRYGNKTRYVKYIYCTKEDWIEKNKEHIPYID